MKNCHKGLISLFGTGIAAFFIIASIVIIVLVNVGFEINATQN